MESMAELMKKLGWIAWCLTVIGWLLSPIVSFLVYKIFVYLEFDTSKKLWDLAIDTIPDLKQMLSAVEEQTVLRAGQDKGSQRDDQKILVNMKMDLKSALYEAEDILDLLHYRQIEKHLHPGDDDSRWVENQLSAACAWIARCKGSWFQSRMSACAWIARCKGSWFGSRRSDSVPADPTVEEAEVEEIQDADGETLVEEIEEDDDEAIEESTSLSMLWYCARSMLTWFAKASFYRDWSYGIVGIKSDKDDGSAAEFVTLTERIVLRNRIKHIEDILTASKKSVLLNDKNSSSGTTHDADNESSSFTFKNSAKESSSMQKEIDDLYRSIEKKVFGRDKERAHISRMLREAASTSTIEPYSVIGINGITGSGKSTLAQYVCDFEKSTQAGRHFDPVMFILVGKTFRVGDIFRDMLEQITQSRPPNDEGLESLKTKLEETLKDKRFLLVLDDLWVNDDDHKELGILLDMLSTALRGSRVLVTSQKKVAAQALGAQEQISIPDLEEGAYLSLFMHHARPDDKEYEKIGRKIANRLGRSPIAAVAVGKQLQRNKNFSFWFTTASLDMLNERMGYLWWSYQQLGVDVRRCFAYCSIFPKGYKLERDQLVRIWIAQGFVNTRSNATEEMEDVGQSYFDQLLIFSFLQEERTFSGKETGVFTIPNVLHMLAERVSGREFFRIDLNNDSPKNIPGGVCHLFINTNNIAEMNENNLDLGSLRTLIINEGPQEKTMERNHDLGKALGGLFMRVKNLRVLIIKVKCRAKVFSIPASIYCIKHLRYLSFQCPGGLWGLILPSTFSKLYHIQTIDIPCQRALCPEDMASLIYLRHISAPLSFPNIGRLTSLQTLAKFRVKDEQGYGLKELKHLNKLRGSLLIRDLGVVGSKEEALEGHLTNKEGLRKLQLRFGVDKRFSPNVEAEVLEGLSPQRILKSSVSRTTRVQGIQAGC